MTVIVILKVREAFTRCILTDSVVSGRKSTGGSSHDQIPQMCQALPAEYQQGTILLG